MKKLSFIFLILMVFLLSCNENKKEIRILEEKNQTLETIFSRKSVREYSEKEISQDTINLLLKAGMSAPSSRDRRPWHFIIVSEREMLKYLGNNLKNAPVLKNANKAIVVCGDTELSDNCWFLDCSAATQNILLAAESMGLGAVWTAVYPYDDREKVVNEAFALPENIRALAIIPLGYPSGNNESKNKYDESRIHYEEW